MSALYVYAVVPDGEPLELGAGLEGHPVRSVDAGGVRALVHELEAATPYAGAASEVEEWVKAHFSVVESAWSQTGTILPMTFDVLVARDKAATAEVRLRQWLAANGTVLLARLDELKNRGELKVEVRLRVDGVRATALDELEANLAKASRGMKVLLEKKREQLKRAAAAERADALHAELRSALSAHSVDVRTLKMPRVGADEVAVLSLALLVDSERVKDVGQLLGELQAREPAVKIGFFGPWPPFSFAELPTLESSAAGGLEAPDGVAPAGGDRGGPQLP